MKDRFDLKGLPKNLIKELHIRKLEKPKHSDIILKAIKSYGSNEATINEIMVGYYKISGKVINNNMMRAHLYRLKNKKILERAKDKGYKIVKGNMK